MDRRGFSLLNLVALMILTIFLVGCGGGDGSSSNGSTDSPKTYNLPNSDDLTVGDSTSWDISGTGINTSNPNDTVQITGTLLVEVLNIEIYDGQNAYPVEQLLSISIDGIPATTQISISYFDMDHQPIAIVNSTTGSVNTPVIIRSAPPIAEIGDFGQLTTWQTSTNKTVYKNWRLEDAGGGYAYYIKTITTKNTAGTTDSYTEIKNKIDEFGNELSQTRIINEYEDNIRFELSYTKR